MNNISRRDFIKNIWQLLQLLFKAVGIGVVAYLLLLFSREMFNISLDGWKFILSLAGIFLTLYFFSKIINRLIKNYIKRAGEVGAANIRALNLSVGAVFFSVFGAMAMRAHFQDRLANTVMWIFLIVIYAYRIFQNEKHNYIKTRDANVQKD